MQTIPAKTIIQKNKSTSWFGTDYTMNIYKGCCHGCIYCDSRSECYHIDNFDTVRAKENALFLIRNELAKKVRTGVIGTGSMSDPYNPFEEKEELTRHALELIDAYDFGVAIATKNALITRDIDVLKSISEHSPVLCKITITASDDELSRKIEPNVSLSSERFSALAKLSDAGIYCGILLMPVLPFIEDNEENIRKIIKKATECGIKFIYPGFGVTLRQNQREYFFDKIEKLFPEQNLKQKYLESFGNNYSCYSQNAKKLWSVFISECNKFGILYKMPDIINSYKNNYNSSQLSFF